MGLGASYMPQIAPKHMNDPTPKYDSNNVVLPSNICK